MKKKYSFMLLSIIQIIFSVYTIFNVDKILKGQLEQLNSILESSSEEIKNMVDPLLKNFGTTSVIFSAIICIVLAIIIFIIAHKGNLEKDRKKLITCTIISYLFITNEYVGLLALIGFVMALSIRKNDKTKEQKKNDEIPILKKHGTNIKDILVGIGFILLYFSDYLWRDFVPKNFVFLATIIFEIILIVCALLLYSNDFKRDFKELKDNKKSYIKYAFKKWGFMLLGLIIIGTLSILIFGEVDESVNQELLKKLPLLYVVPSAIIMAPIVEETIFRVIFRKIIKNDYIYVVVSGLLFGLLHVTHEASIVDAVRASLPYITMGVFLAHSYVKTNNSLVSMMIHAIQNTFGCIFMIF